MEKYKKVLILLSIVIGFSVGSLVYNNAVAIGEPFVQVEAYGEFDYIKISNREFTMYLTKFNCFDRESLEWVSIDYQEIDVVVVIDGIEYERSMFCYKGESSELEVESAHIIFSFYMEENVYTFGALLFGAFVAVITTFVVILPLWMVGEMIQNIRTIQQHGFKE